MSTVPEVMPVLSPGRHRTPRQGACFMEFASYLAGKRWSDHPRCTHPALASLARDVNDLIGDNERAQLAPLIHRVIGLNSADPTVFAMVAMRAASAAYPVVSLERQRALAAGMLNLTATVDHPAIVALATQAFLEAPDCERWARNYLAVSSATRPFDAHSAAAMTHTAAVGIALACVTDTDARLASLLRSAIEDVEQIIRPTNAERHTLISA